MRRRSLYYLLAIIVATSIVLAAARVVLGRPAYIDLDAPESQPIKSALEHAYQLFGAVACDPAINVDVLDQVLVDTTDYRLDEQQKRAIESALGSPVDAGAGYLSARKAHYLTLRGVAPVSSSGSTPNVVSTSPPAFYCPTPAPAISLTYQSIAIQGDRAMVKFDDGAASQEAILRQRGEQWLISSLRLIWAHF